MGDTIDLYTFFHKIQAEYPHYVILATDDTPAEYEVHCSRCGQNFYVSTEY